MKEDQIYNAWQSYYDRLNDVYIGQMDPDFSRGEAAIIAALLVIAETAGTLEE